MMSVAQSQKLLVRRGLFLVLFSSTLILLAAAQENRGEKYKVSALRVENASLKLDGILDEPEWQKAEAITEFTQRNPYYGRPATEKNLVRILYDDDNLYVGAVCFHKDINDLVAHKLAHRDVAWDDLFSVVLDTFHDHTKAYCFQVNPLGAKNEVFMDGPDVSDSNWNEVWDVKTKINKDNWSAEFKIPLRILRFSSQSDQTWGLNLCRLLRTKNESDYWSPIPPQFTVSNLSLAGDLAGLRGLKPKRNLQVRPYGLFGETRENMPERTIQKADFGLDLKYVPTPNLAVDMTVRPDFAQIESDDVQINLTRFDLFFPEKRDFFLENAKLFDFGLSQKIQPFFSRQIGLSDDRPVPILFGGRMTGKFGRTNIGFINALTEKTDSLPLTNYTVLRARQDLLRNSNVGFILTNVQSRDGYNRCWGIDGEFWLAKNSRFKAFFSAVDTGKFLERRSAAHLSYALITDPWGVSLGYNSIGRNYNPAAGFVVLRDIRDFGGDIHDYSGYVRKSIRPNKYGIRLIDFTGTFDYIDTRAGGNFFKFHQAECSLEFDSADILSISLANTREKFFEDFLVYGDITVPVGVYSYNYASLKYTVSESKRLSGNVALTFGGFYQGRQKSVAANGLWMANKLLMIGGGLETREVHLPQGNFTTLIGRLRLNLIFSSNLSLKTYVQYSNATKRVILDFRLCWLHGKDNELYFVYNNLSGTECRPFRLLRDTAALKLNYRIYL